VNERAVEFAMRMIVATQGEIAPVSVFARKNYFYPDLPKGYQISQYDKPIGIGGAVAFMLEGHEESVQLNRIHLEEDAGKSLHPEGSGDDYTRVDLNRCGTPLIEIVSEPDIHSAEAAFAYLHALKQLVEYLRICDGNMEQGSLRCDANVSVRAAGQIEFGTKTEVKNLNSIHGVQKAITYEINRQISILETGGSIEQETLLYNAADGKCYPMRSKEESHDYRYFPDPDLVTLEVSQEWINRVAASLPELPLHRRQRFVEEYQIPAYDAEVLTSTRALAEYFEETAELVQDPKAVSNWIMTEVMARLNEQEIIIDEFAIKPERLGDLIKMTLSNEITGPIAKEVFAIMQSDPAPPDVIVDLRGLAPLTDSGELEKLVDQIIAENPEEVARFRAGHKKLMGFFVGNVMKATQGKADPKLATQLFNRKLGESQ
jgi:aspartyl-tRNA(Asn)/glutamyl-tRNA(Gln) amidotransferase subunit B